jgi:SAM-dependent methyltransferase
MTTPPPIHKLFDHDLLQTRYARLLKTKKTVDFLQREAANEIADRLTMVKRSFAQATDLFSQTGQLTQALANSPKVGTISRRDQLQEKNPENLHLDPQSQDLITSALALQWANDLPGLLIQINRALKPGGLFLGALLGGETLNELRTAFAVAEQACEGGISPRIMPFADIRQMGALLQRARFEIPVADRDILKARYASPLALMGELRRMGGANAMMARRKTPLRRKTLNYMIDYYNENFSSQDGRITASFEIIYLSGWRPKEV